VKFAATHQPIALHTELAMTTMTSIAGCTLAIDLGKYKSVACL